MKYKIRMQIEHGRKYCEEIWGEPFVVDGYEEFQLFSREAGDGVIISEVTTGMQIGNWYPGLNSANEGIRKRIEAKGADFFRKLIAENRIP